jgi:hypothetical protein
MIYEDCIPATFDPVVYVRGTVPFLMANVYVRDERGLH